MALKTTKNNMSNHHPCLDLGWIGLASFEDNQKPSRFIRFLRRRTDVHGMFLFEVPAKFLSHPAAVVETLIIIWDSWGQSDLYIASWTVELYINYESSAMDCQRRNPKTRNPKTLLSARKAGDGLVRGCAARHRWIGLNEVKAAKLQIYAAHLALWHDGKPHDHSEITIIHIGWSIT